MDPQIIFEDSDYLVLNKPAGLAVHGGGNIKEPTLVDWLLDYFPPIKEIGEDASRPGIVHRLDKEVSGLMVVAKTAAAFKTLKDQFKEREINKEYIALVHGRVENEDGEINFPIKRSREGHKMAAMPLNAADLLTRLTPKSRDQGNIAGVFKAREALTQFHILKRFVNYTLLQVKIKTGRTHQIRVHFYAYGYPLVGDGIYCTKKTKDKNQKINLGRVFLVATHLSFKDLEHKTRDFQIDLPQELKDFLPQH